MKVDELLPYLKQHNVSLKQSLLGEKHRPHPICSVEIPKSDSGLMLFGIPPAVDRMVQKAIAQVLFPISEKEFFDYSYGFRPVCNVHQSIKKAEQYIN
jgi:retron-type reverse transcriptase